MSQIDAVNAYRLFLGRQPESERVVHEKADVTIAKLAAGFLGSKEFLERVLPPLSTGYPLPHFRVGAMPGAEMLSWAGQHLPLSEPTRVALADCKTWRQLLRLILADKTFRNVAAPGLSKVVAELDGRVNGHAFSGEREIVGCVDHVSVFEIRGWAADLFCPNEPLTLEIFLDNSLAGIIQTGDYRRDAQEIVGGSGEAGFIFNIPAAHQAGLEFERLITVRESSSRMPIARPTRVRLGQADAFDSLIRVRREIDILASNLDRLKATLPAISAEAEYPLSLYSAYQRAARTARMSSRSRQSEEAAELAFAPGFSIVLEGDGEFAALGPSINSLRRQTYRNWECVIAAPLLDAESRAAIDDLASADSRIRPSQPDADSLPWQRADQGARQAKGDYLIWLREGDLLSEDALFELAKVLQSSRPDLLYFDEDRFQREAGTVKFVESGLKSDLDVDHLLACNYIDNAFACKTALFRAMDGFCADFGREYGYDFLLRAVDQVAASSVVHVEKILYHRNATHIDAASEDSDRSRIDCVNARFGRIGSLAVAEPHRDLLGADRPGCRRIVWPLPDPAPKLSIIIPTRDRAELLRPCVDSVLQSQAHYPTPYEILVVDNDSREDETHALFAQLAASGSAQVVSYPGPFNWSAINNVAAKVATGDILIFLNNDTRVLTPDWTRELASIAMRPEVGAVGARLLYQDGTIQHAGVVLGGRAVHEATGERPSEGGYLGRTLLQRNASAVTGACLATRKALFVELGGFDAVHLKVAFNDVDYCLRVRNAGFSVIYTPFATLYHFESKSRGLDDEFSKRLRNDNEIRLVRSRWPEAIGKDPFYNSRFNRTGRPFTRLRPEQLIAAVEEQADDDQELWDSE